MADKVLYFTDFEALNDFILNKVKGEFLISYLNCDDYPGMVLGIMLVFDINKSKFELDLQWISFGLDFYGDSLQETYVYQFESLKKFIDYLQLKYSIKVNDIPLKYKIDQSKFPNPLKDKDKKLLFENAWNQFQDDFKTGAFLDTSLKLVYSRKD